MAAPGEIISVPRTLLDNRHSVLKRLLGLGPWADGPDAHDARDRVPHGDLAADDAGH